LILKKTRGHTVKLRCRLVGRAKAEIPETLYVCLQGFKKKTTTTTSEVEVVYLVFKYPSCQTLLSQIMNLTMAA